jgi:hypothetical protein
MLEVWFVLTIEKYSQVHSSSSNKDIFKMTLVGDKAEDKTLHLYYKATR